MCSDFSGVAVIGPVIKVETKKGASAAGAELAKALEKHRQLHGPKCGICGKVITVFNPDDIDLLKKRDGKVVHNGCWSFEVGEALVRDMPK